MNEELSDLPQAENADPDGVQVALRAAQTLWSRGDTTESLKWLRKAAESASDEGADLRSLQLAKAAAELRAKLFGSSESAARATNEISGAHPIASAQPLAAGAESELMRSASMMPQASPLLESGVSNGASEEHVPPASRPITATQYPSHRPRQRMGLSSPPPGLARDGSAPSSVPSWSADSERRASPATSSAPPPLPQQPASLDDYEELEAEPDEDGETEAVAEPADDPASVWSSAESWRPELSADGAASRGSAVPPPLPPRGAYADDDFAQREEPATVVIPPADEAEVEARAAAREARRSEVPFSANGHAWDQQALRGWDDGAGASWAAELRNAAWGSMPSLVAGSEPVDVEPSMAPYAVSPSALPPDAAPPKLTARVHHQAVRVSFAPDLRVPGQYVVRPLREGEKAASGERIALLVALEPGVPLV